MSLDWESIPPPPRVGDDEELERRAIEAQIDDPEAIAHLTLVVAA